MTNPLRDDLRTPRGADSATIVIFGATGDLTRRKLMPALFRLARGKRLPSDAWIIGVGREAMDEETFRARMRGALEEIAEFAGFTSDTDREIWDALAQRIGYVGGELTDRATYDRIRDALAGENTPSPALFYLAIPPTLHDDVITHLGETGLAREEPPDWRRVIVEKPFGTDLDSARALNRLLHAHFDESQVFRIDHYLGKETVQNLLVFRFGNGIFEPVWNRRYIDHVQITAAETEGVGKRAAYYEEAGALRDMVQNHLLQLLAIVAMEPPTSLSADRIRDRKVDAIEAVQPLTGCSAAEGIVRAQYGAGWVNGEEVVAYSREPGVRADSRTETFVALRLELDTWRWAGVPFYLRTGKRLPRRATEIAIEFKRPPLSLFGSKMGGGVQPNLLVVRVQPDEGIALRFGAKLPGSRLEVAPVMMDFRYNASFGADVPEAYETLLVDALRGDQTLFARHDMVDAAWRLVTPIHTCWAEQREALPIYESGEWGPREAHELMARDGRAWRAV